MYRNCVMPALAGLMLLAAPAAVLAGDVIVAADTAWVMTATALVLFMTVPGLALFYGGLVRTRNVLSVLMQCFAITCMASLVWLVCGYSLAFGEGSGLIGNLDKVLFSGMGVDAVSGSIPESVFALYQMTFAIITPALIVGGFAERVRFGAVMLFSTLWLLLVYVPVTHWVWGRGGWLSEMGLLDFAGGTVVHITAGVASLVCAMALGPRTGFGKTAMPPHNLTMTVAGAGMLWVGWFGFNGGSALAANGSAGMAMLATHISAAGGAVAWMLMEKFKFGKASVLGIVTGMVAGLGTITAASGFVGPGGALLIGLCSGVVCFFATQALKQKLHIDDSLDVFPVHGVGGIMGTFLAGVFASPALGVFSGRGYAEGMNMASQMGVQLIGIVVVLIYSALLSYGILRVVQLITGFRVSVEEETTGLDIVLHDERGYDL